MKGGADQETAVIETMTPSGVEQLETAETDAHLHPVIETMTPSGVEQNDVLPKGTQAAM